jgi:hypothetical protein
MGASASTPRLAVNVEKNLILETLEIPSSVEPNKKVKIYPPHSNHAHSTLKIRLLSAELREGMVSLTFSLITD